MGENLYQTQLLNHHKEPIGFQLNAAFSHHAIGENAVCGDEIVVNIRIDANDITAIGFNGESCAICRASASIMCSMLNGRTLDDAQTQLTNAFNYLGHRTLATNELPSQQTNNLAILSAVHQYPIRLQCARLPWETFDKIIKDC